jgi:hypothetical protein
MTCTAAAAVIARHAAAILVSMPTGTPAMPPRPDEPSGTQVIVERVEVPTPVHDTSAEILRMQVVAAVAAAVAAAATRARLRRRYDRPTRNRVIDITDR